MLLRVMRENNFATYKRLVAGSVGAINHKMIIAWLRILRNHYVMMMLVRIALAGEIVRLFEEEWNFL